jgi:hypothetical protein
LFFRVRFFFLPYLPPDVGYSVAPLHGALTPSKVHQREELWNQS